METKTRRTAAWLRSHPVLGILGWGLVLNFLMECLCRRNPLGGIRALVNPLMFLLCSAIIILTLAPALFFKRRTFYLSLISLLWLTLGVSDCVVTGYRNSPISAIDFAILPSVISILNVYFKTWQLVLIGVAIAAALAGLVVLFFKTKKLPRQAPKAAYLMLGTMAFAAGLMILVRATGMVPRTFPNLAEAYRDYGFVYCFSCSALDRGISRPQDYSEQRMDEIAEDLEDTAQTAVSAEKPNIVFVQLESLFDPTRVRGLRFSRDPLPNLRALREMYPSGLLTVPSVGAGTANTEFEILTGMSLDYFGPGEYPYETVLRDRTCESVAYDLKALGYGTHVIHDNKATFYSRHQVFPNLGFDSFTSIEYMQYPTYNPIGWCDDSVLSGQILDALISTEGPDLVYTISVQGHGKYPREALDYDNHVAVWGMEEENRIPFRYYVNQIYEMDEFVMELIRALESYAEPTILVLYGDHLPNFEFLYDRMKEGDCFQTEYVIWSNIPLQAADEDLYAYQLTAHVLGLTGESEGLLTKLHQNRESYGEEEYQHRLELMEYDMLYGDMALYDGWMPHEKTQMQMGVLPITVTDAVNLGGNLAVIGENFTPFSKVWYNGEEMETEMISNTGLVAYGARLEPGGYVVVTQQDVSGTILSVSNTWVAD